jgi:hypothetical protein
VAISRADKERIVDSRLKIQSVASSLSHIDPKNVPHFEEIRECLEDAEKNLSGAIRSSEK